MQTKTLEILESTRRLPMAGSGKLHVVAAPHQQKILVIKVNKLEEVSFATKLKSFGISHLVTRDISVILWDENIERRSCSGQI
jgi:hypothetical protein